ncbi:hypothetical protein U9M48_043484 [Paspalum notatum var. saurae]|uniref:Uncharacterized protein n=1 Tax=Paspalum notatum var. saurae TaxID=547442 RepID=A0AAQ3XH56_PASNO
MAHLHHGRPLLPLSTSAGHLQNAVSFYSSLAPAGSSSLPSMAPPSPTSNNSRALPSSSPTDRRSRPNAHGHRSLLLPCSSSATASDGVAPPIAAPAISLLVHHGEQFLHPHISDLLSALNPFAPSCRPSPLSLVPGKCSTKCSDRAAADDIHGLELNRELKDDADQYGVTSSRRQLDPAPNLDPPQALGENLDPTVL